MRDSFSSATLLTSRSWNHGLNDALDGEDALEDGESYGLTDPACLANVNYYINTGNITITDGETCKVRCFFPH